jgi:hypothetical protein
MTRSTRWIGEARRASPLPSPGSPYSIFEIAAIHGSVCEERLEVDDAEIRPGREGLRILRQPGHHHVAAVDPPMIPSRFGSAPPGLTA